MGFGERSRLGVSLNPPSFGIRIDRSVEGFVCLFVFFLVSSGSGFCRRFAISDPSLISLGFDFSPIGLNPLLSSGKKVVIFTSRP